MSYRIETHKIIEHGIDRVEFDPSKVKLVKDTDEISNYNNDAERFMFYKYEDLEIAQKIYDLSYSLRWGETTVQTDGGRYSGRSGVSGLNLFKKISTKLRKRPNKEDYTQASLDKHKERANRLDKYDLDYAKEQFKLAIDEFNVWYVERQTKETIDRYSEIGNWNCEKEQEIIDLDNEEKELEEKIRALRKKTFDKRCELVLQFIENREEKIHSSLKPRLIEEVNKKREEGYKNRFFL